jgi:hypothetical protein
MSLGLGLGLGQIFELTISLEFVYGSFLLTLASVLQTFIYTYMYKQAKTYSYTSHYQDRNRNAPIPIPILGFELLELV